MSKTSTSTKSDKHLTWVIQQTDDIHKYYDIGEQLGQPGQFGHACICTHLKSKEKRAVKVINKARFSRQSDRSYHFEQLRSEITVMKSLNHKNIIKMYEVFEDLNHLYIVMEICSGGELFDRIKEQGAYSELDASKVLRQMFEGVNYLHSKQIAHCDLKPDNFLFLSESKDAPLKIIDFGMSKFVKRREYFQALVGTPYYVAPEVVNQKYSEHCDLWSLGVVMFVMLFGYPPFYADQEKHGAHTDNVIFQLVKKGFSPVTKDGYGAHFPKAIPCSDAAKDLMAKLLTTDTAKRITASEAIEHPWLTGEKADSKPRLSSVLSNLSNFNASCKFKQEVLRLMSDSLSETEINNLKKTFTAIDVNGDGVITVTEMKNAIDQWGNDVKVKADHENLLKLMKVADVNGDGQLSYEELLMTCVQRKLNNKEERLWEAFRKFDLDGDGKITIDEIEKVLGTGSNAKELIAEIDKNGDGSVDYDEFISMWSSKGSNFEGLLSGGGSSKEEAKSSSESKE